MTGNSEYDALGELFRRKLENHRTPVNVDDWNDIERRMGHRMNKSVIWMWISGAMTAAATIAALLMMGRPATDNTTDVAMIQKFNDSKIQQFDDSTIPGFQDSRIPGFQDSRIPGFQDSKIDSGQVSDDSVTQLLSYSVTQSFNDSVTHLFNDSVNQSFNDSVIEEKEIPKLDVSLVADNPEEDETDTKKTEKWLLAAAFGTGGNADNSFSAASNSFSIGFNDATQSPSVKLDFSGNNEYAVNRSNNIISFDNKAPKDFSNISHRPPFSFGLTARKNLGKRGGVESGLVYTYLASRFKWSEWTGYEVQQNLHYVGIPVNMVVYLWNSKPNWRIYLSGGFMVEKGLRAIYRQERQWRNETQTTTVKTSSIDGWQWSLNSALGVNYRLEKGWGVYFEPRVGYSFDCNQPVSIRTESPVYFGVNLGLNFEL